jgi:hypothetical protein
MKVWRLLLWILLAAVGSAGAIDREAFTITRYQLDAQIDRTAHVLVVTGKLTLRNDSKIPQKLLALQVSSSLAWNGVALDDKPLPWIEDEYTSDIDHTSSLSEVIVTLPKELPAANTVTLDIQYGGTITTDASRFTRMGAPADVANRNDWDEISDEFTAVRGVGYVTWYPVAIEAASLSDGNAVFDAIARWKERHARSEFDVTFAVDAGDGKQPLRLVSNLTDSKESKLLSPSPANKSAVLVAEQHLTGMQRTVPTFAIANYVELTRPTVSLLHTPEHTAQARDYALAAEANDPLLHEWLGDPLQTPIVVELSDPNANPYQNGSVLFTPLRESPTTTLQLRLMPVQVAARFQSPHLWIEDGVQHFLQALGVERRSGRAAALKFIGEFRQPLVEAEEQANPKASGKPAGETSQADNTLLNTNDEVYLRGKGGYVFWMLRDMVGNEAMQRSLLAYRAGADKNPGYLQQLLQTNGKRDLEWFFDDWVYRDRGLPEFHVESAYARPLLGQEKIFLVTATVENRGRAGAEVPVMIQTPAGEKSVRVLAKAGEKGTGRIEVPAAPDKAVVNDGSVPEANSGNNVYEIHNPQQP